MPMDCRPRAAPPQNRTERDDAITMPPTGPCRCLHQAAGICTGGIWRDAVLLAWFGNSFSLNP